MRKPREIVKGATYHVGAKINRGEYLFEKNPEFKSIFFQIVHNTHKRYKFRAYAITVMDNHIHMMIKPEGKSELGNIMNSILSTFARRYNLALDYHGHVWYDRFKSKVIITIEQFINTLKYICNNPVRAGIVKNPLDYKYSVAYAICTNARSDLEKTILNIVDLADEKILKLYKDYIAEFDIEKALQVNTAFGFYPGKSGRPKKIVN